MRFKLFILFYYFEVKCNKVLYSINPALRRKRMLNKLFKNASKSDFYKKYLSNDNRLEKFPILNKAIFMSDFNDTNTVNVKLEEAMEIALKAEDSRDFSPVLLGVTVGLSSGTSGNRGVFLASEKERAYWVALILDRVIGFSLRKRSVAFFLRANSNLYNSVQSKVLSFEFFDLLRATALHVERLNKLQPHILVAQPSMLLELAKAKEDGSLAIHPSKIISVAEVLTPEDKSYLTKVFNQTIHQVYQCTEGFLASSCKNGTLHFNEDFLIIEKKYIDDEQKRFHPIITDLKRTSQPIIRYELNDIVLAKQGCSCGSLFMAIEAIEGRSDDVLQFINDHGEEVNIFPDFFRRAIILAHKNIVDYELIQMRKNLLNLFIECEDENAFSLAVEGIHEILDKYNVHNVEILNVSKKQHQRGNKLRRIKNDIKKSN